MSQKSKHYQIIQLENGEIIVVHETWVSPEKQHVFWPPYPDNYTYRRSLENSEEPAAHWTIHPTKRVIYQTDNLPKALAKVKEAEYTSNIDSDDENVRRKRVKYPSKRYLRLSDSERP
ncbi:hypothetical protein WA026_010240 [Henosepilachna vigintioctopunctata]|uniref:Uncharacterized protein n=1 Tax=Henosepilachna vigintioctopunctata TaxID=420089 RepID=A0AAW1UJW5_9CUCU